MGFFNKPDPAEKQQRALEAQLAAARTSRGDLVERRNAAEAAAAKHRESAVKLASDGADDKTLSAAEAAMRRELDRAATLSDAIAKVEITITTLEAEIAEVVDRRCRAETAAAIRALVEKWSTARGAFDAAMREIVDVARETTVIVTDALPLKVFVEAVALQVPPEVEFVTSVLQGHARAVLAGTAPASLPKLPEPVQPKIIIEQVATRHVFCLKSIKWRSAAGHQHAVMQYEFADLPISLADKALRSGAACVPTDDRCKLNGSHGGRHPNVNAIDIVDLDAVSDFSDARHASFDPVASANITPFDRGIPERKNATAGPRL